MNERTSLHSRRSGASLKCMDYQKKELKRNNAISFRKKPFSSCCSFSSNLYPSFLHEHVPELYKKLQISNYTNA